MEREDLIEKIEEYDAQFERYSLHWLLICKAVILNGITFRGISEIHIVEDVLWLDDKTSVSIEDIGSFLILPHMYDKQGNKKRFGIIAEDRD